VGPLARPGGQSDRQAMLDARSAFRGVGPDMRNENLGYRLVRTKK
jgi:hypothetical protein